MQEYIDLSRLQVYGVKEIIYAESPAEKNKIIHEMVQVDKDPARDHDSGIKQISGP
jgi:hypothetical protein